jgi:alcohol dehydrogenase (cytochrome c)
MRLPIRPSDLVAETGSDHEFRSHLELVVDKVSHVWSTESTAYNRRQPLSGICLTEQETREAVTEISGVRRVREACFKIGTRLFYVMVSESCSIFSKSSAEWEPGKSYFGGANRAIRLEDGSKVLRALDLDTGAIVWELRQPGDGNSFGGILSTRGGLVFFGEDSGAFVAADAKTGQVLWHFNTSTLWKASPMTYMLSSMQYVAVAAGPCVVAFGLPMKRGGKTP